MASGVGYAIGVRVASLPLVDGFAMSCSPVYPGPFVVVAVMVNHAGFGAELTIVPEQLPHREVSTGRAEPEGIRFMERRPRTLVAGDWHIGDPFAYPDSLYLWPWYVFEGSTGAFALWVQAVAFSDVVALAYVSVWGLKRAEPAAVPRAQEDPYAAQTARLAEWRRVVERQLTLR